LWSIFSNWLWGWVWCRLRLLIDHFIRINHHNPGQFIQWHQYHQPIIAIKITIGTKTSNNWITGHPNPGKETI
jgi:hypothetical protein